MSVELPLRGIAISLLRVFNTATTERVVAAYALGTRRARLLDWCRDARQRR
jgi:hypothetical protein